MSRSGTVSPPQVPRSCLPILNCFGSIVTRGGVGVLDDRALVGIAHHHVVAEGAEDLMQTEVGFRPVQTVLRGCQHGHLRLGAPHAAVGIEHADFIAFVPHAAHIRNRRAHPRGGFPRLGVDEISFLMRGRIRGERHIAHLFDQRIINEDVLARAERERFARLALRPEEQRRAVGFVHLAGRRGVVLGEGAGRSEVARVTHHVGNPHLVEQGVKRSAVRIRQAQPVHHTHHGQEAAFGRQRLELTVHIMPHLALAPGVGKRQVMPLAVVKSRRVGRNRDLDVDVFSPLRFAQLADERELLSPGIQCDRVQHRIGLAVVFIAQFKEAGLRVLGARALEPQFQRPVEVAQVQALGHFAAAVEQEVGAVTLLVIGPDDCTAVARGEFERVAELAFDQARLALHVQRLRPRPALVAVFILVPPRFVSRHQPEVVVVAARIREDCARIRCLVEQPQRDGVSIHSAFGGRRGGGG